MPELLQHVLVTAVAGAALVWLARRRIRNRRSCGDCALAKPVEIRGQSPPPPRRVTPPRSIDERSGTEP